MNLQYFKLVSGEDILAEVTSIDMETRSYRIIAPLSIRNMIGPNRNSMLALLPWNPIIELNFVEQTISSKMIISTILITNEDIKLQYNTAIQKISNFLMNSNSNDPEPEFEEVGNTTFSFQPSKGTIN